MDYILIENDANNSQTTQLRLWHPQELAVMFTPVSKVVLMKELETARKHLGNAITTNHACFLLVACLPLLVSNMPTLTTRDALISLLEHRLTKDNLVVHDHLKCWLLTKHEEVDIHAPRIEAFMKVISHEVGSIPYATFYHEAKGVLTFEAVRALWQQNNVIQSPITPTQSHWMKLQICIQNIKIQGTFIQPLIVVDQILGLWSHHAVAHLLDSHQLQDPDQYHFQQLVLGSTTVESLPQADETHVTILFYHSHHAWIVRTSKNQEDLHNLFPEYPRDQPFHTALQRLDDTKIPATDMVLYSELPPITAVKLSPGSLLETMDNIQIYVHTHPQQDIVILMVDLKHAREQCLEPLWTFVQEVFPHKWMQKHGRMAGLSIRQGAIQIQILPNLFLLPLPIPDVLEVTLFHMLRTFWTTLSCATSQPYIQVRMKWEGKQFWQGKLPAKMNIEHIRTFTLAFIQPILDDEGLSIVAYGQKAGDQCTLEDLQSRSVKPDPSTLMLAFVPTLKGGGPIKQNWDTEIRNQVATTLLPLGVPVENLANIADAVLKATGRPKLQQILKQNNQDLQKQQLIEAVENAGFSVKKFQRAHAKPQPLIKKPRADQIRQELLDMDLDGIQIEPGFFFSDSEDTIPQIDKLYPKTMGIVLTKEDQIRDWLTTGNTISPDPLGAFVVGVQELETILSHQSVLIPARTAKGLPLILSGSLVQFGERHVHYKPQHDDKSFQCDNDTQVVSVTAWKDELSQEDWQDAVGKPANFMQSIFAEQGSGSTFLSTWGTSYQSKGKAVEKNKAESIQIHATIQKDKLPDVLRKSGIHGLYVIPKSQEGTPDQEWKIIWLLTPLKVPGARDEVLRTLSRIQQPFGIVRNKTAFGIRVREDHFNEAWKIVHPQQPIPATIADKNIYKVTPLPFGCPPEAIKQWLQHIAWSAVLIRPIGPKSWIIAATEDPPSQFVTFNGHPTLIRRLPSRETTPLPAVVAGQKPHASSNAVVPPQLGTDPWARYTPTTAAASSTATTRVSEPAAGMVQKQMQKQDDKIQQLAEEVTQLRKMQETAQQNVTQRIHKVEQAVDQTKEIFSNQLTQLKQELETSFQQAITTQNGSINQGFAELKTMFLQNNRTSATRRTWDEANKEEDAAM